MNIQEALNILRPTGNTDEALKSAYRIACKRYHPDVNPDGLELMKLINAAYDFLKKNLAKWNHQNVNYDISIDEILQEIINKIKKYPGIELEICGTWLWVSGETRPYKEYLKEAGLRWAPNKHRWYWRPESYRKKSKKVFSMDEIRAAFGTTELETEPLQAIA